MVNVRQWHGAVDCDSTFVLLLEDNVGWLFVDSNPEAFKFGLDYLLVRERLIYVKDDEYQMASFRHCYHLSSPSFTVLGTLDDTRKIQHLNGRPIIFDLSRNGRQGRELICGSYSRSA